ncbi:hypothetical protein AT959_12195 [Dechloromonas denitrificans]|uniref:Glycosyl transferase family 1 domain-containing protein n=2 Tax=Dechloromonas denitrificans TaxID=281362 RepID=A0A133XGS6_9RHOO|nr:hypothetical protein AT959_12195 [Dechloromonas denitrificans]
MIEPALRDPLFGFVMPLTVGGSSLGAFPSDSVARDVMGHMPYDMQRVVEGPPVLVRSEVLLDFGPLEAEGDDLSRALASLFIRANRRGYSARLCNAVFFPVADETCGGVARAVPALERASDYYKALDGQTTQPETRLEALLTQRFLPKERRDVLFDIRNLAPGYNGTAQHILSLLPHFVGLAEQYAIWPCFWVLPQSAAFHNLAALYPEFLVHELPGDRLFDACVRLSQPWSFSELRDQAYRSSVNIYAVLDTIAWDCHYVRMPHLDGVWRSLAEFADGLLYISDFSRKRFNSRFPASKHAENVVAYCSMNPPEYLAGSQQVLLPAAEGEQAPYILVCGNSYYHKGLNETVHALSAGFPSVRIKVIGELKSQFHNVEQVPSGNQSAETMAALYRNCVCLVFPSFYEGFGLPIFEALAFARPVVARHSELIDELCEKIDPVKGIFPFSNDSELLRTVKRCLTRAIAPDAISGKPGQPYTWKDSAEDILRLVDRSLANVNLDRCRQRLEFFYRVDQFDIERAGWTNAEQNKVVFEVEQEE